MDATQDSSSVIKDIASQLRKRGETVCFAESCTGGTLSGRFTDLAGISDIFIGSVVSYSNLLKETILGVNPKTLEKHGAVSREVALEMAKGARLKLSADWSVAITGVAGPTGGTSDKPVGTVCFAVVGPDFEVMELQKFETGSTNVRDVVRKKSVTHALELLAKGLKS